MTDRAQAILEQAEQLDHAELEAPTRWLKDRLEADDEKEGIRIARERKARVERGGVEMIPWDEAMKGWRKSLE